MASAAKSASILNPVQVALTRSSRNAGCRGFSLLEALVVVAISSILLTVLSQVLVNTQRTHQTLQERFSASEAGFYGDFILRQIISNIIDYPASSELAFSVDVLSGEERTLNGHFRNNLTGSAVFEPVEISLKALPDGSDVILLKFSSQETVLPLPSFYDGRFFYLDADGQMHEAWPPETVTASTGARVSAEHRLPEAMVLESRRGDRKRRSVFKFNHGP